MKKIMTIELKSDWVLSHREDDCLPLNVIAYGLEGLKVCEVKESTFTELTVVYDDEQVSEDVLKKDISDIFSLKYPGEDLTAVASFRLDEYVEPEAPEKSEENEEKQEEHEGKGKEQPAALGGKPERTELKDYLDKRIKAESERTMFTGKKAEDVEKEIDGLIGAQSFKLLAKELVKVAPLIKESDVFVGQSYLFSIGDGCGLTTYLKLLSELIHTLGIAGISKNPVVETRLDGSRDSRSAFDDALEILDSSDGALKIMSIDISEWMNKTDGIAFKQFLHKLENNADKFIYVFRIPFVEKDVMERVRFSLGDLLSVRALAFPPLDREDIKTYAKRLLSAYGFRVNANAWDGFFERISLEKSDGKFYGLNTVKKVVKELVYKKLLKGAGKRTAKTVTANDMTLLGSSPLSSLGGKEMLDKLVGNEDIKKKIEEMLAQIELSTKENRVERPCIHMRFVGNPGTGKTTVARIVGKILKERGVLRVGNFYEYSGRDFCGRYVGETAPKTAGICRDAYGSVLFIDEAYSLYRSSSDGDYGREALETLIAEMENHRDDFVVIMAGYTDDMDKLLKGNAGLASRMPYTIEFPNFTREQLFEIFKGMVTERFRFDDQLFDAAHAYFMSLSDSLIGSKEFSNARFVRNLFERTWAKAALRSEFDKKKDVVITKDDFECASKEKEFSFNIPKKTRIGF